MELRQAAKEQRRPDTGLRPEQPVPVWFKLPATTSSRQAALVQILFLMSFSLIFVAAKVERVKKGNNTKREYNKGGASP